MYIRQIYKLYPIFLLLTIISCSQKKIDLNKELAVLKKTSDTIKYDFTKIIAANNELAEYCQDLYSIKNNKRFNFDTSKLLLNDDGIFYKPKNDSGSAIYVSGYFPVDKKLKNIVYITNPLDSMLNRIIKKNSPLAVQAYFIEKHSYLRIYPYIDVLSQFEPKLNFENFNVYCLADIEHDPYKNVVIVSNPYVDPAGRGWIISSIAPVYYNDEQQGVVGIDITLNAIKKKFMSDKAKDFILMDSSGIAFIIDEKKAGLFDISPLKTNKYSETIKRDEHISEEYNLLKSKNKDIRNAITDLVKNNSNNTEVIIDDEKYFFVSYKIPSLNWFLIKIIKED